MNAHVHAVEEDPKTHVTQHAFRVSADLLGTPLSGPWRRGMAIAVDGVAIALLANASGIIFGVAVAFVVMRASIKPAAGGVIRRSARFFTRAITAIVIFGLAASLWGLITPDNDDDEGDTSYNLEVGPRRLEISSSTGLEAGGQFFSLLTSDDDEEARERLSDLMASLRAAGLEDEELLEMLREAPEPDDRPWIHRAVLAEITSLELAIAQRPSVADSSTPDDLLADFVTATAAEDTAEIRRLRSILPATLARDTIQAAFTLADEEAARADALEADLEAEQGRRRGILSALQLFAEDLGLGLGWTGLYFTAFTVLWRGQTPGKRWMGIRVLRLDGMPIGWFAAFERFAGYAAGLATGLLGFMQIFWDRNRQAIQDKIAGTVVIRDSGSPKIDS